MFNDSDNFFHKCNIIINNINYSLPIIFYLFYYIFIISYTASCIHFLALIFKGLLLPSKYSKFGPGNTKVGFHGK